MIDESNGQEFQADEVAVLLDGKPLEHVLACDATAGWARLVEIDYRTGQPVQVAPGEFSTVTVRGAITLLPKGPPGGADPFPAAPGLDQTTMDLACTCKDLACTGTTHWGAVELLVRSALPPERLAELMAQISRPMRARWEELLLDPVVGAAAPAPPRWGSEFWLGGPRVIETPEPFIIDPHLPPLGADPAGDASLPEIRLRRFGRKIEIPAALLVGEESPPTDAEPSG